MKSFRRVDGRVKGGVMRVLIACADGLARDGMALRLKQISPTHRIAQVGTPNALLEQLLAPRSRFDFIFIEILAFFNDWQDSLPEFIIRSKPGRVVAMAAPITANLAHIIATMGVSSLIPRTLEHAEMVDALRIVLAGGSYFPWGSFSNIATETARLSPRQIDVLRLLSTGAANKMIAAHLQLSEATIKLHISALMRILNATNRTDVLIRAQRLGLVE